MDPVVRLATADDIEELGWLQDRARSALVGVRGGELRLRECHAITDWRAVLADPGTAVYVGTLDAAVLGYLVVQFRGEVDRGVITVAFVEEGARELGLGDTMVEHAIADVRSHGLTGIEAVALPGDRETKNLYERAGLTARKITVYKALPRDGS